MRAHFFFDLFSFAKEVLRAFPLKTPQRYDSADALALHSPNPCFVCSLKRDNHQEQHQKGEAETFKKMNEFLLHYLPKKGIIAFQGKKNNF